MQASSPKASKPAVCQSRRGNSRSISHHSPPSNSCNTLYQTKKSEVSNSDPQHRSESCLTINLGSLGTPSELSLRGALPRQYEYVRIIAEIQDVRHLGGCKIMALEPEMMLGYGCKSSGDVHGNVKPCWSVELLDFGEVGWIVVKI